MSWFAVDDRFWSHRKVMRLRRSPHFADAIAVWTLGGSWCTGDHEARDTGVITLDVIAGLGVPGWEGGVHALIAASLFDAGPDGDSVGFHDWDFWNGPNAKTKRMEKRLEDDRIRQRRRRAQPFEEDESRDQPPLSHMTNPGQSRDSHVTPGNGYGLGGSSNNPSTSQPSSSSAKRKTANDGRDDARRICEHLADRIEANGSNRPNITVRWLDSARLLIDQDSRTEEQIHKAIDWCQDDEFWRANVMSLPKLRAKYDQLRLRAMQASQTPARVDPPRVGSGVWDRVATPPDREKESV